MVSTQESSKIKVFALLGHISMVIYGEQRQVHRRQAYGDRHIESVVPGAEVERRKDMNINFSECGMLLFSADALQLMKDYEVDYLSRLCRNLAKRKNEKIMKSGSSCLDADAFIILTKQGIVLASGDARIMPGEDRYLYELNQKLIERKRREDLPDDEQ